ncbi:MAG TPA: DUF2807 domain-containing protein [Bacteroidia bacterium]|nr:DUF2807 domain-containing protein [Bacteroidia bacterium]MCB0850177.1 DUF2807 domain-containing protein [Bacteroidota bacterium]OQB62696.1 MAG: hypothetical protein BWX95_01307 [Bacteroidetes bacterium ADurb.Bin141]HNR48668.1 DUF2807 domain-containing protein [Bacteroidia bacterium]HNT81908.1 DUF2807 domain-containing protein [Bacteroidia bacterium]
MYRKIFLSLAIAATGLMTKAQIITPLNPFNELEIKGASKVILENGTAYSIQTPDSSGSSQWQLEGNRLIINGAGDNIQISAPGIKSIEISGSGSLTTKDSLTATSLKLIVSGSGKISLKVANAENLDVNISGSGKTKLEGRTHQLTADISGSGKLLAQNLKSDNANINISGVGTVTTATQDTLTTAITGTGSIYYKGTPKHINREISGIGKIEPLTEYQEKEFNKNDSYKPNKAGTYWAGLDIGFNGFYNSKSHFDTPDGYDFLEMIPEKSIAVNINFYEQELKLYKNYILASTGVGLSYNNFRFRKNMSLIPDTNALWYTADTMNLRKNKLTVSYLTVPVLLTINTSTEANKAFHITAGMLFSYKLGSHTKKVYNDNGSKKKDKTYDDFNIDPFRYDATVRIGYRNYTLFANYALSDFFKKNKGPELRPWTIGVSLVPW